MNIKDGLITGQLILRPKGQAPNDGTDRTIFMVIGIVAVPKEADWKGEHIVPVVSNDGGETLSLFLNEQEPLPEDVRGFRADNLLCHPIWRV